MLVLLLLRARQAQFGSVEGGAAYQLKSSGAAELGRVAADNISTTSIN